MSGSRTKVVLGDADVADICNGRGRKNAVGYYAKKYGVSTQRVRNIWAQYFGGTTLEAHRTGLKTPLPGGHQYTGGIVASTCAAKAAAPAPAAAKGGRKAGKFVVDGAPDFVPAQGAATRAKPVRAYKPPPPPPSSMTESFNEELAEGELRAGNNSGDLAHIMERLLAVEQRSGGTTAAPSEARGVRRAPRKEYAESYTEEASTEPSYADEPDQSSAYEASDVDDAPQLPVARAPSQPPRAGPMGHRRQVRERSPREPSELSTERRAASRTWSSSSRSAASPRRRRGRRRPRRRPRGRKRSSHGGTPPANSLLPNPEGRRNFRSANGKRGTLRSSSSFPSTGPN